MALWGTASSGKDEVARLLSFRAAKMMRRAVSVALADPFKRFARDLYGIPSERLWGPSEERTRPLEHLQTRSRYLPAPPGDVTHPTTRDIMQLFNHLREADPDVYVHKLLDTFRQLDASPRYVRYDPYQGLLDASSPLYPLTLLICTDARQANEVQGLKRHGVRIIRIKHATPREPVSAWEQHPSEKDPRELPDSLADEVIVNDFNYPALVSRVDSLYDSLVGG